MTVLDADQEAMVFQSSPWAEPWRTGSGARGNRESSMVIQPTPSLPVRRDVALCVSLSGSIGASVLLAGTLLEVLVHGELAPLQIPTPGDPAA